MIDLKPYHDAVVEAEAEVQRVASEIDTLFRLETDEGRADALAKQPDLEAAQKKFDEATGLYESMQKANRPNDIVKNFVPISASEPDPDGPQQPSTIKRAQYDALSLVDRAKFIQSGGTVED